MADQPGLPPLDLQTILRGTACTTFAVPRRNLESWSISPCIPLTCNQAPSLSLPGNTAHCSGALFPLPLPNLPVPPIHYQELLQGLDDDFQDPAPRSFLGFSEFSTTEVRGAGGQTCKVDPALLIRMGPPFQAMLGGKFVESLSGRINLPSIETSLFQAVYHLGLQEFFPETAPAVLGNFSATQLVAMLRFAHTYEMKFVCARLRRNILSSKPHQLFFDVDEELELDMQKPLLRQLIRTLAEPLQELPTFSDPEIYSRLWPSIFPVGRMISPSFFTLQSNFVKSLLQSKLANFDVRVQPLGGVHELLLVELADSLPEPAERAAFMRQALLERNKSHPYSASLGK